MIKKFYSKRNRPGWKYDARLKRYYSWGFDIRLGYGRRKREPGFSSRADAESAVAQLRSRQKEIRYGFVAPKEVPTLREVCDRKLDLIVNSREKVRATRVLQTLCDELPELRRITELETAHLQRFVERRKGDGLSASSINRELNIVSAALHVGPVHFAGLKNWTIPRLPRPKQRKRGRERVITAAEATRVLTWLYAPRREGERERQVKERRTVGHVLQTALLGSARKGELCKIRWSQVDWQAGVIQIIGTKTENVSEQTSRYLKITPTLEAILRERLAMTKGEYVFTRAGGEVTYYYQILAEACRAAGVLYGKSTAGGFVTHDARHTAITRMLQDGRDLATIGSITGQSDRTMILHYGHASTESRDRAMDALENFAGNEALGLRLDTVDEEADFSKGFEEFWCRRSDSNRHEFDLARF